MHDNHSTARWMSRVRQQGGVCVAPPERLDRNRVEQHLVLGFGGWGLSFMVYGCGLWFMVYGLWFMMYGVWFMV